jgi:hypothetical protein
MPLSKADLFDVDFLDAPELRSDGRVTTPTSVYMTTTGVSTTSGTSTVVSNPPADGEGFLTGRDHPVEAGDLLVITGSTGADGTYTVATIVDDVTVTVVEPIPTSTGGTYQWVYPAGSSKIGFNPTGQSITTASNVQQALKDVAAAITGGSGITEAQHQALDTLVHDIDENSYDEVTRVNGLISQIVTWDSPAKTLKIRDVVMTRNSLGRITQIVWTQYDALGAVKETLTEVLSRTCNRVSSITRTRVP